MKYISILLISFFICHSSFAQLGLSERIVQAENISQTDGDNLTSRGIIVKKTSDNNIIAVINFKRNNLESITKKDSRYDSVAITKFNLNGDILWQKRIKIPNYGFITDISNASNGGYVICGNSGNDNFITHFDANGNALGSKSIPNPYNDFFFRKIEQTRNGNYVIASVRFKYKTTVQSYSWFWSYFNHLYNADYFIGMVDATGNVLWNQQITYHPVAFASYWSNIRLNEYEFLSPSVQFIFEKTKVGNEERFNFLTSHFDTAVNIQRLEVFQIDSSGNISDTKTLDSVILSSESKSIVAYNSIPGGYMFENLSTTYNPTYSNDYYFNKTNKQGNLLLTKRDTFITGYGSSQSYYDYWNYTNNKALTQQNDSSYLFFYTSAYSYEPNLFINKTDKNFHYNWRCDYFSQDMLSDGALLITQLPDNNILCITGNGSFNYNKKGLKFYKVRNGANQLSYKVYVDKENNGIFDGDDYYFYNAQIQITNNNFSTNYPLRYDGTFNKFVDIGTYTSKLVDYENQLTYFNVVPEQKLTTFTNYNNADTIVFRLVPTPEVQDLQADIIPMSLARPGFEALYKVMIRNVGTKTVKDIKLRFLCDTMQTLESCDVPWNEIVNDTAFWNIDSMIIYENREFNVVCRNELPPTLDDGDTLHLFAYVAPFQNDTTSKDNFFNLDHLVVNSLDPNDKLESHAGALTYQELIDREYLYYTIRFQNVGSASAVNIVVKDTLEENLDWSTFEMIEASHTYEMNVNNNRNITWTFSNIFLPDSITNEPYSHGYVHFRIRPVEGLSVNTVISNTAAIYFDYNPPLFTNTVTTQIVVQRITNIQQKEIKQIKLYPSPTRDLVQLEFNAHSQQNLYLKIVNVNGSELRNESLKPNAGFNTISINLGDYANGIYFIQLTTDDNNLFYGKVLKQ